MVRFNQAPHLRQLAQRRQLPLAQAQRDAGAGAFLEQSVRRVRHRDFPEDWVQNEAAGHVPCQTPRLTG